MIGGKISLGLAIALVTVSSAFNIYYVDSQNTIQILQENVAKLEVAVEIQKKTIEAMKEDFARQAKLANELQSNDVCKTDLLEDKKIVSVEILEETHTVYNLLSVSNHHNFYANNILVHNK